MVDADSFINRGVEREVAAVGGHDGFAGRMQARREPSKASTIARVPSQAGVTTSCDTDAVHSGPDSQRSPSTPRWCPLWTLRGRGDAPGSPDGRGCRGSAYGA